MRPSTALTLISVLAWIAAPGVVSPRTASGAAAGSAVEVVTVDDASVTPPQAEEPPLIAWRDLADKPCRWLGRKVRVRLQYESEPARWNPYLTRFGSGQYDAVKAWADEQYPWIEDDFASPRARVFVRKGSSAQHELVGAEAYSRYELTLVVREVFLDEPWAEIVAARPMLDHISEATVIHAARALDLMSQHAWKLALLEFDAALSAPLPDAATAELVRLRDICSTQANEPPKAHGR